MGLEGLVTLIPGRVHSREVGSVGSAAWHGEAPTGSQELPPLARLSIISTGDLPCPFWCFLNPFIITRESHCAAPACPWTHTGSQCSWALSGPGRPSCCTSSPAGPGSGLPTPPSHSALPALPAPSSQQGRPARPRWAWARVSSRQSAVSHQEARHALAAAGSPSPPVCSTPCSWAPRSSLSRRLSVCGRLRGERKWLGEGLRREKQTCSAGRVRRLT